ncbi:MAG TPA: PHP domain-containing protein [Candidatus Nitrosotalea sp.]|nr:PHP domain-containing protein [Candidatus Nitrosotalea sp.]
MSELIRVDLHVHSSASFDCAVSPEHVVSRCRRLGLSPVFLTDHNSIEGAMQLQSTERVIAGEEVMTTGGELIGLFLREQVPAGLGAREAAIRIKDQGGLVYLEHPYDPFRRHLSEDSIEAIADLIDIVEVFNGRSEEKVNRRAEDLCAALGAAPGAGSDAHSTQELGGVYIEMEDFDGAEDFLVKLAAGRIVKRRAKWLLMAEAKLRPKIRRP